MKVKEIKSHYTAEQLVVMHGEAIAAVMRAQELVDALRKEAKYFADKIHWETVAEIQSLYMGMETMSDDISLLYAAKMLETARGAICSASVPCHLKENVKAGRKKTSKPNVVEAEK